MYAFFIVIVLVGSATSHFTDDQGQTACTNLRGSYVSLCSSEMQEISELSAKVERLSELREDYEEIKRNLSHVSHDLEKANGMIKGICDVFYDGKCFVFHERRMLWAEGKEVCENRGWKMANIYSEEHYNMIMNYMRKLRIAGQDWTRYWSGMTVDANTKRVSLSDGSDAPFVKWHPGYPTAGAKPYVVWQVRHSPSNPYQNMWNNDGTDPNVFGVVCEY